MTKPTYEDAHLMLEMARLGIDMNFGELTGWLFGEQFIPEYAEFTEKYPPDSEEFNKVRSILMWYETLGTLYKQGLFNGELLFDWVTVKPFWERLKGFALGQREKSGNPRLYENFEALAKAEPQ